MGYVLRFVIAEYTLQNLLNDPATGIVQHHDRTKNDLELGHKWNKLQLLVDLRDELCGTGEGHRGDEDDTPVHALVLLDAFSEGPTLVVDSECGDLLDELQEVDCRVEQRGFKFTFEIDEASVFLWLKAMNCVGNVDESGNMDRELAENGWDDVPIPDVVLRALLGKSFDRLETC